jgi:hypothetical protein
MKVRKAIKRIAALGAGATMLGATLMGAMAADLSDYPGMFIEDGQFNGLLVVGEKADAIDTIGMTNIALGMQKAAVTRTTVCGTATSARTTVSGEQVQIEKTGEEFKYGSRIGDVLSTELDDGDLPSILADGEFDESEGNTDNDVTYEQKLDLGDSTEGAQFIFDQDDRDAPEAGPYLFFAKGEVSYTYSLEFDDEVEWDPDQEADDDDDFEGATLELQGQTYTIISVDYDGTSGDLDELTMMVGESVIWIMQGETVTKEVNGVEHSITMIDVNQDADACGFSVDGSTIWIDKDDTRTVSGVTLGVTDALAVYTELRDGDMCKVFIGAEELVLKDGNEVEVAGVEVDGSVVDIVSDGTDGTWTDLTITFDPDDDIYLGQGDEWVDPVFGNFKFIMGGVVSVTEEIRVDVSSNTGELTFTNYDDEEVVIPFILDEDDGSFNYGDDEDLTANPDDGFYLETDVCAPSSNDITDCAGAEFLVVSDNVAHVVEISGIDDPDTSDPQIDFDDLTYGTSSNNNDYGNEADDCTGTGTTADPFVCDFDLSSDAGTITLTIDLQADEIEFTNIDDTSEMFTQYEGEIQLAADASGFDFIESTEADTGESETITIGFDSDSDNETIEIDEPTDSVLDLMSDGIDASDTDDDTQLYYTVWGSIIEWNSDDKDVLVITHPESYVEAEVFVAETGATTTTTTGSDEEGCQVVETQNPISSTVNKFDTEVSNYQSSNVIAIGGPCANSVASALLGNPEVCYEGFEEGKSILQLFEHGDNVALLVAGATGKDTRAASKIIQDYENYDLQGTKMEATTVSMTVAPFTETAVVEDDDEGDDDEQ